MKKILFVISVGVLALLADPFSQTAKAQVSVGATHEEVIKRLGEPYLEEEEGKKLTMRYGQSGKVILESGRVVSAGGNFSEPVRSPVSVQINQPIMQPQQPPPPVEVKKKSAVISKSSNSVNFEDSAWSIVSARNIGNVLKGDGYFLPDAKTDGKFIVVRYKVTNKQKEEDSIFSAPGVVDHKGRKFGEYSQQISYFPREKSIGGAPIPSGMAKEFMSIYEVTKDSFGLKFQARELKFGGEAVDLDLNP